MIDVGDILPRALSLLEAQKCTLTLQRIREAWLLINGTTLRSQNILSVKIYDEDENAHLSLVFDLVAYDLSN